ncbi:Putative flippase GtrA (transmembrane translocase of bactoprenol-linked glucose) [Fontibacillus panacisegetis]|uniref:Putative flippase GtrA (Transmembrane translocase of bactoprenol-linked glucose) n=2 Tax=Fontibacillus panacisegetis TaxID=670482 RepID=A0A1G7SZH2_9BACL|nr:Putative flippase GtrA (transmembrane translocase of bactoprenol-linked glucose) [Fontibacillus panacisegetis]
MLCWNKKSWKYARKMSKIKRLLSGQFFKYGFVGIIGTVIHTGILWLLTEQTGLNPLLSSIFGYLLSLLISYYLNSILTFKRSITLKFFIKYATVSSFGLFVNITILFIFENILLMHYMIGQIISIVVVPILNFILNKYWAFNTKSKKKVQVE